MRVLSLIFLVSGSIASQAAAQEVDLGAGETLLQISATGSAEVAPDLATLSAGITTTGRTAREAIDSNSRVAERIVAALRGQGVAEKDVQTQTINVSPQFSNTGYPTRPVERGVGDDLEAQQPRITGYIANNQLQIRIRDLEKASDLVDDLFEAGANNVYGPNFALENQDAAMVSARQDAIRKMQAQAEDYAAALGKRIVRLAAVSDRGGHGGPVYRQSIVVTGASNMVPSAPPPPPPAPVEAGALQVTSSVWGDYILSN